jgi:endo-1,4-beta-xylanase
MDVLTNTSIKKLEEDQARVYYDMLRVCLEAQQCTAFTMWGFSDRHSWYRYYLKQIWANPLIYDDQYRPKSAYYGLLQAFQDSMDQNRFRNNKRYPQ